MKKIIFFEIIRRIKSDKRIFKKLKIFVAISLAGIVLVGGLTLWMGLSAFKYVAATTNQVIASPLTQEKIQSIKGEVKQIQIQPYNCWDKATSLMNIQPWLELPIFEIMRSLKVSCLYPKPSICNEESCDQLNEIINTAEGRII